MLLGRVAPTCEASLAILLPHLPIDGFFVESMFRSRPKDGTELSVSRIA